MATTATSTLPSGIVKYEDYQAQQKATPTNTNMGQTEFLTLFTTQLKNQNPLDPVKNEAFVAQLAQFSQLEATTAMKTSMQNLVSSLANDRLLGATSLIGKTVGVPDGPVAVTDTTVSQGVLNAPTGADGIKLEIFNDKGILVRTQIMGPQPAGDVTLAWDGMNDGVIHLHGHVHLPPHLRIADGKAMDVGVDGNGLKPILFQEIRSLMKDRPIKKLSLPKDHHEKRL